MKANQLFRATIHPAAAELPIEGVLPSLGGAIEWLNSRPLTAVGLRGNVVLISFWTYTCINWLRSLPYVRAWAETYKDHGLVVIGVHTPEFAFERNLDNVRRAAKDLRVEYPIAIDSDYAIWRAFDPATTAHRRSTVRDRVSRSGRGGLCVHLWLDHSQTCLG